MTYENPPPRYFPDQIHPLESLSQLKNGLVFPLSHLLTDHARTREVPTAFNIHRITHAIFKIIPDQFRIKIRGSTPIFELLRSMGIERRGTISNGLDRLSFEVDALSSEHPIKSVFRSLIEHASDIDCFFPDADSATFSDIVGTIRQGIQKSLGMSPYMRQVFIVDDGAVLTKPEYWLQSPIPGSYRSDKRPVQISIKPGTVNGIHNCTATLATVSPATLVTSKSHVNPFPVMSVSWAQGKWDEHDGEGKKIMEQRRDPRYALSWDRCYGEVVRRLPMAIRDAVIDAIVQSKVVTQQPFRRLFHNNGVFPPDDFAINDWRNNGDTWFHFPRASLELICKPLEVGEKYNDLPIPRRFVLALRACQKTAMGEELLQLTPEGKQALSSGRAAPAISPKALYAFNNSSTQEVFNQALVTMNSVQRRAYSNEVVQYMLTGFFYPHKFIEYCQAAGIFKHFPNLANLTQDDWKIVLSDFPDYQSYLEQQHQATHTWDDTKHHFGGIGVVNSDNLVTVREGKRARRKFINPYLHLVRSLQRNNLIPTHVRQDNYLLTLQEMFALPNDVKTQKTRKITYPLVNFNPDQNASVINPQPMKHKRLSYDEAVSLKTRTEHIYKVLKTLNLASWVAECGIAFPWFVYTVTHPDQQHLLGPITANWFLPLITLITHVYAGLNKEEIDWLEGMITDADQGRRRSTELKPKG